MRNIPRGQVFKFEDTIPLKKNQTISKGLANREELDLLLFSLAQATDISEEYYEEPSGFYVLGGRLRILGELIEEGQFYLTEGRSLRGVEALEDSLYLEFSFKEDGLVKNIEKGQALVLKELLDYVDGGISNLDLVSRDNMKMVLMAFDKGEGLSDHAAPGDALVMALEGVADLRVGDEIHEIKEGESLVFPKGEIHNVRAKEKFKMALVLVL